MHAVLCAPGLGPDAAALQGRCAERLANYKVVESIEWRAAPLPRNANGEVMKRLLGGPH